MDTSSSGIVLSNNELICSEFSDYVEIPCASFNCLYRAKRQGRWFVLKGLKPEYAQQTIYQNLLRKEYELTSLLYHPNIVSAFSFEYDSKIGKCIVLEYVEGYTLREFLRLNPSSRIRIAVVNELLDGLQYIHSKQIIHRDLKPSNILVSRNGNHVKIIDFGLADSDSHAILKQPAGSANYIAPEQLQEGVVLDCRSDLYSFGKILQEIFPLCYRGIVKKCTAENRDKRYVSAKEIQQQIRLYWVKRIAILPLIVVVMFSVWLFTQNSKKSSKAEKEITEIERVDTVQISEKQVDSVSVDCVQVVQQKESFSSDAKKNVVRETPVLRFDVEEFKHQIDSLFEPFCESLYTNKFESRKAALDSLTILSIKVSTDIWIPIKDSGVFSSVKEEIETWLKYASPYLDSLCNMDIIPRINELPFE